MRCCKQNHLISFHSGLASAFSPPAQFVCCQQNPANFEETENDILEAVILQESLNEANKEDTVENVTVKEESVTQTSVVPHVTQIVTELVTETETEVIPVTSVEAVTEMVTEIVTEIVNSTGAGWQAEQVDELPEDWMAMTEEEAMAFIRSGGVVSSGSKVPSDDMDELLGLGGAPLSSEEALKLMGDSVDRMDVVLDYQEEEDLWPGEQPWEAGAPQDFLESLGAPAAFSSVLTSLPDVVEGTWEPEAPNQPWGVPGNGDVFEFEIGAEIPGAGPAPAPEAAVLVPGQVIDDTPALHHGSVVSTPLLSVHQDSQVPSSSFVGSIEPVSLDYSVIPEIQTGGSGGEVWYESIVLGDAVPGPVREYDDYVTGFTTEKPFQEEVPYQEEDGQDDVSEPELDCTMSILWGFQCSLSGVDKERSSSPSPVPLPVYPVDRMDVVPEEEEAEEEDGLVYLSASDAVHGLVEVTPPSEDLGWVTELPQQEGVPDLPESNKAASSDSGEGFDQSGIEVSLPEQFLESQLGEEVVEKEADTQELFDVFRMDTREAQPRLDDEEVVVKYANLDKLIEDEELLKIVMDTLENQTLTDSSFSLTEVLIGNKNNKTKNKEMEDTEGAIAEPEPVTENLVSSVSDLPHPDFTTKKAEERRKRRQCGVKGGRSVVEAYGEKASAYMMDFFIDSWVFGKNAQQKARFEDTEARIIGGKVTSTMLYCWIAAIVTKEGEFVCTGTLVADDLVVTTGSCINL